MKQLDIIFNTFINTISSILNVGLLMFLILFIYAVIGVNLFGDYKLLPPLTATLNFQDPINVLVTIFRMSTGEGWDDVLDSV